MMRGIAAEVLASICFPVFLNILERTPAVSEEIFG